MQDLACLCGLDGPWDQQVLGMDASSAQIRSLERSGSQTLGISKYPLTPWAALQKIAGASAVDTTRAARTGVVVVGGGESGR